ncbi:SsrA-binding protein [Sphingobacterium paludis]|uniref:SsrA-binding protein n=2 Tax=Sphingobacterium paludis TaxID=1476465 RepID=A0A4R7CWT3_9SPHI|nr:SsrA-binding protein [Sphingobacterium paludis]
MQLKFRPKLNFTIFAVCKDKMGISGNINIKNKRASFEYHLLDRYTAGIRLLGTEIKSIREAKANINDSFCSFLDDGLYIRNMHIAEYSFGSFYNHEAKRDRQLLLTKRELKKLKEKGEEKGFTIVPLRIFISERGFAKVEIALAQGKKDFDKRETIKERESKRELDRVMKY